MLKQNFKSLSQSYFIFYYKINRLFCNTNKLFLTFSFHINFFPVVLEHFFFFLSRTCHCEVYERSSQHNILEYGLPSVSMNYTSTESTSCGWWVGNIFKNKILHRCWRVLCTQAYDGCVSTELVHTFFFLSLFSKHYSITNI